MREQLKCFGGARDQENPQFLSFGFNREPTDDEFRFLLECMQRSAALAHLNDDGPKLSVVKP